MPPCLPPGGETNKENEPLLLNQGNSFRMQKVMVALSTWVTANCMNKPGLKRFVSKKIALLSVATLMVLPGFASLSGIAQSRDCLRIMPIDELTRKSIYIARVKVVRSEKANYRGLYGQLARIQPVDVIEGDFTLKELNVLGLSNIRCAEDFYAKGDDVLVFLEPEDSLYRTLNYQYGQFEILGDVVKGWRDKENKICERPYAEVRREIEAYMKAYRDPKAAPTPIPVPQNPIKPPDPATGL